MNIFEQPLYGHTVTRTPVQSTGGIWVSTVKCSCGWEGTDDTGDTHIYYRREAIAQGLEHLATVARQSGDDQ